ncbi:MAG: transposase [Candidatus Auribacterota bacterium]|nr:transposase [Candidatus Auribacterota bacterium]
MPRTGRIVAERLPHHITQRGNYRQDIFLDREDRERYLVLISEYSRKYKLSILAYCLMNNHVHFIGIPKNKDSLAKTFNTSHMRYSQYFNKKKGERGHLWQGRFYSCVLDEEHLLSACRYIERNPVRAKLIDKAWKWEYSSALVHTGKREDKLFNLGDFFEYADIRRGEWKRYIECRDKEGEIEEIKRHTLTGRPLGDIKFIEKLEKKFKKRLRPLAWGRPKKKK